MRTEEHPALADGAEPAERDFGHRFVAALAARDAAALLAMFGSEVDFQALTPGRTWQARTAAEVVGDVLLGAWFGADDTVERAEWVETGLVGGRLRLGYRLQVVNPAGRYIVEQQAFLDLTGGRISWLRMLCSGFRPLTGPAQGDDRPAP